MKDWQALQTRYLRDRYPTRMGNLASNLARIKTQIQKLVSPNSIEYLLQESKFFIEWTGKEADIDTATELVEIQLQLARWQLRWQDIWESPIERAHVAERCRVWSERVLELSGLL
jgi:hypothetical protein